MSTQTEKLGLFKYDPVADKEELFDIQTSLNDNWDKIDEAVGSFSQADWNQNDPNASNYVKNRTHWKEDPVIVDNEITLEETTYDEFDYGYCEVVATINFVEGANCVVTWDGIEYESVCGHVYNDTGEYYVLGNPMLLFGFYEDPEDNGQPFGIVYIQSSKYLCFVSSDFEAFSHTVKITSSYTIQEFHKLDNKYIDAEWMAESPIYDRVLDIEETVLTGEPYDGVFIAFLWLDNFKPLSVMEKATFNIILDGVEYTSVSEYGEFGNLDLRYGNLNGGDPYYGVIYKEGIEFTFPSEGDHTISLTADNFIYKQLSKEYLPTSVQGAVSYSEYQSLPIWA